MEVMLYPLKFKPILKSQIWGGDRLVKAGKRLPANCPLLPEVSAKVGRYPVWKEMFR